MADKKTRAQLGIRFDTYKTPTRDDFRDLFASAFNQLDDGIRKHADEPLELLLPPVDAATDPREVLRVYEEFTPGVDPLWKVQVRESRLEIGRGYEAEPDLVIGTDGKVGIGTTDPNDRLEIRGDTTIRGRIAIKSGNQVTFIRPKAAPPSYEGANYVQLEVGGSGHAADNIRLGRDNGGNEIHIMGKVGIGTDAPEEKLHIRSNLPYVMFEDTDPKEGTDEAANKWRVGLWGQQQQFLITEMIGDVAHARIGIKEGGNVGIGTDDPASKLHVDGDGSHTRLTIRSGNAGNHTSIALGRAADEAYLGLVAANNQYLVGTQAGDLCLRLTNQTQKIHLGFGNSSTSVTPLVLAGGNVGIGTDAPDAKLHLQSTSSTQLIIEADADNDDESKQPSILLKQDGGRVEGELSFFDSTNNLRLTNQYSTPEGTPQASIVLHSNGNVGVGTENPTSNLHVDGDSRNTRLTILSGNAANHTSVAMGRANIETYLGLVSANSQYLSESSPGDFCLRLIDTNKKIRFGFGAASESATVVMEDDKLEVIGTVKATKFEGSFEGQGSVPVGSVIPYAGQNAPDGWVLCDGRLYSKTTFKALFDVIGTTYGESGDQFRVPNLQGQFIAGAGGAESAYPLNAHGGDVSASITLTKENLPRHTHDVGMLKTKTDGAHLHRIDGYDENGVGAWRVKGEKKETSGSTEINLGDTSKGGSAHEHEITGPTGNISNHNGSPTAIEIDILPPYRAMHYIIKY